MLEEDSPIPSCVVQAELNLKQEKSMMVYSEMVFFAVVFAIILKKIGKNILIILLDNKLKIFYSNRFIYGNFKTPEIKILLKGKGYPYQLFLNNKEKLYDSTLIYKTTCSEIVFAP